jgi:hypothetical protein
MVCTSWYKDDVVYFKDSELIKINKAQHCGAESNNQLSANQHIPENENQWFVLRTRTS